MNPMGRLKAIAALALILASGLTEIAISQEIINRREEARAAFLATPEGIYEHYCAHCHGDDATGFGRLWASELTPIPADLTALKQPKEYLLAVIRDGTAAHGKSNLCPPWGRTISPANVERLAQHIASLGEASQAAPAGTKPVGPPEPAREHFPWLLSVVLLAETVLLCWMLQSRKKVSNVIPEDPLMRG